MNTNKKEKKKAGKDGVQAFKNEFLKEELSLVKEKEKLGFGGITIGGFLDMKPSLSEDQSISSNILNLQDKIRGLQEKRPSLFPEEIVVEELNKKHAVVHTDRFYILTEKKDPILGGMNFTLESKQSFKDIYENQVVKVKPKKESTKANIWLKSPSRRHYEGIVFHPDLKKYDSKYYNIWKGFSVTPKKGCCKEYKTHIKDVICNGNIKYFNYVWKWLARLVQEPHKLPETAIVLVGEQGTGKNTFVNPLGEIFGGHYLPLDNIHQLLGQFNFHLKNAVLVHGNEALWGGNRKDIGKLKATITEKHKVIEGKGKDSIVVPNFTHLILSSNEDWPVHLDRDDRRFFVLKVSGKFKEDSSYFEAIYKELKNGGSEALLYELLNEDISQFEPRKRPQNIEAFDIKMSSSSPSERYIFESLKMGCFDIGNATPLGGWVLNKSKRSVFDDYQVWCKDEGIKHEVSQVFGKLLKKLIPSIRVERSRDGTLRIPN